MQSYLRVKIKSLAAEARIIRGEERRLVGWSERAPVTDKNATFDFAGEKRPRPSSRKVKTGGTIRWLTAHQKPEAAAAKLAEYYSLHRHRTYDVRNEARAAQIAYGFLCGTPYRTIEKEGSKAPPLEAVRRLITKYRGDSAKRTGPELDAWFGIEAAAEPEAPKKKILGIF